MKTKYDWSSIPKEYKWCATDADGMECHYKNNKPIIDGCKWDFYSLEEAVEGIKNA